MHVNFLVLRVQIDPKKIGNPIIQLTGLQLLKAYIDDSSRSDISSQLVKLIQP